VEDVGTPLIRLHRLSNVVGRSIYVKMESLNPSGTGKDRAALRMVREAESRGLLPEPMAGPEGDPRNRHDLALYPTVSSERTNGKGEVVDNDDDDPNEDLESVIDRAISTSRTGGLIVEGTSGSTGIALATIAASRGHGCLVVLPDDQAVEKQLALKALGAVVFVVPTASISNPNHYVNVARKAAHLVNHNKNNHRWANVQALFVDQFENIANYRTHYDQTGPEILRQMLQHNNNHKNKNNNGYGRQCRAVLDAFVMSSGTGGTIAGIGRYLKEYDPDIEVVLVDPPGSSLYHKVEHGVAYAPEQSERSVRRHRYDTVAEGIGSDRVTGNLEVGLRWGCVDSAVQVSDQDAVDMAQYLLRSEGLWVGSSSAMNVVGAVRVARTLPSQSTIVTVICDGGQRHATRFWNPTFLAGRGLVWPDREAIPECLRDLL
jgi:cysteine synthase A